MMLLGGIIASLFDLPSWFAPGGIFLFMTFCVAISLKTE